MKFLFSAFLQKQKLTADQKQIFIFGP